MKAKAATAAKLISTYGEMVVKQGQQAEKHVSSAYYPAVCILCACCRIEAQNHDKDVASALKKQAQ